VAKGRPGSFQKGGKLSDIGLPACGGLASRPSDKKTGRSREAPLAILY